MENSMLSYFLGGGAAAMATLAIALAINGDGANAKAAIILAGTYLLAYLWWAKGGEEDETP
jgi:hypothetical protein